MEKEKRTVKEKLLQAGLTLFSEYGYDATSTRMLAKEADVTRSSIAFYFETKEAYYKAVMEQALKTIHDFLNPLFEEITNVYANNQMTPERACEYSLRLLKIQIDWFYHDEYASVVKLIMKDQTSADHTDIFYDTLYQKSAELLARLIMTATGIEDKEKALMIGLALNGAIQSMGEHKNFTYKLFHLEEPGKKASFIQQIQDMTDTYTKLILNNLMEK